MKIVRSFAVLALLAAPALVSAQTSGVTYEQGRVSENGDMQRIALVSVSQKSDLFALGKANGVLDLAIGGGDLHTATEPKWTDIGANKIVSARAAYSYDVGHLPYGFSLTKTFGFEATRYEVGSGDFAAMVDGSTGYRLSFPVDVATGFTVRPYVGPSIALTSAKSTGHAWSEEADARIETGLGVSFSRLSVDARARFGDARFDGQRQVSFGAGYAF